MLSHRLTIGKKNPLKGPETLAIRQPMVVAQWRTVAFGPGDKHQQKQGSVQIPAHNRLNKHLRPSACDLRTPFDNYLQGVYATGEPIAVHAMTKQKSINLRDIFLGLQAEMVASLTTSRRAVSHPGALGDSAEIRWLKMLGDYLPQRYCVAKAFILDVDGRLSDQIDVVIYDRQYSPFLFNKEGAKYVPAESAYAVFEVKQELDAGAFLYASQKAESVRRLRRTSAPIPHAGGVYKPKVLPPILAGILSLSCSWRGPLVELLAPRLAKLAPARRLNLGCCLKSGSFSALYGPTNRIALETCGENASLIFFFLKLLSRLQAHGTVAALDFNEYGRVL